MQKVYILMIDNGDGSCSLAFFRDEEIVHGLLESNDYEAFWPNEGDYKTLTFPLDLNLESCGFRFCDADYADQVPKCIVE